MFTQTRFMNAGEEEDTGTDPYDQILHRHYAGQRCIGLGSGRTIVPLMQKLSRLIRARRLEDATAIIPSSIQSETQILAAGLSPIPFSSVAGVQVYFDGADFVNPATRSVIKGHGGALTSEKLLASSSEKVVIIVQPHKLVPSLSGRLVPVEIIPNARTRILSLLREQGLVHQLREGSGKIGPVVTELGNIIVDVEYSEPFFKQCKEISGVVEHGFFPPSQQMCIEVLDERAGSHGFI